MPDHSRSSRQTRRAMLVSFALGLMPLAGCQFAAGVGGTPFAGRVLSQTTGEPVPGAIVVFARRAANMESAIRRRAQIGEARSDSNGAFHGRAITRRTSLFQSTRFVVVALAPGYMPLVDDYPAAPFDELVVRLKPAVSESERAEATRKFAADVGDLYLGLRYQCVVEEIPQMLDELKRSGAVSAGPKADSRRDEKPSC